MQLIPWLKEDRCEALCKGGLLKPRPGLAQPLTLVVAHLVGPVIIDSIIKCKGYKSTRVLVGPRPWPSV